MENLSNTIQESPLSTKDIVKFEFQKCAKDPAYFIKKYCYIVHAKRGKIPFAMYPFQERTLKEFRSHNRNLILKSRQLGISTLSAAYSLWILVFQSNKYIEVIATKQSVAKNLITKVRYMHNNLPIWMQRKCTEDNKLRLTFDNGSVINSVASADDAGRSSSSSLLVIDEAAFIRRMDTIWTALQPTLNTGGDLIVLSTPNGVGNWFHQSWIDAEAGNNTFNTILLPWQVHPDHDQAWRDLQDVELGERKAAQECDCDFLSSGDSVIPPDLLSYYEECHKFDPILKLGLGDKIWIWKQPEPNAQYVISADVARGDGKDYSTFEIIDINNFEQVAEFEGKISPKEFGDMLVEYGVKYNDALVVVENASIGLVTLQRIIDRNYINLHYTTSNDKRNYYDEQNRVVDNQYLKRRNDIPGFTTSSATRPIIIAKMEEVFREKTLIVHSSRLLNQLRVFVYINSKPQSASGYNDDLVMALAIGVWSRDVAVQQKFKNLETSKQLINSIRSTATLIPVMNNQNNRNPFIINSGNSVIDMRDYYDKKY